MDLSTPPPSPTPDSPLPEQTMPEQAMPNFTHAQIRSVVIGILLCILLAALDQTVVVPAVPAMAADLNAFGHLSWIVTAYLLTTTATTPIYGKLSDVYGRRAILLPSLVLFILASIFCAVAQSLTQLIIARGLQGIGGAGLMSMSQAAIADVVAPRERGRYQAYTTTTWGFASVVGPILGGYVTDNLSWRWVFWINIPLGLLAILLSNRALKLIPVRRRPTRTDYLGASLLIGAVTSWLLLLSWGGVDYPWASPQIVGLGAAGAAMMAALAWQERRFVDPLLPPRIFANQVFCCGVGVSFFAALGMFSSIFLLPLFFQLVRGVNAETSGYLVMPFLAVSTVSSFGAGMWLRRTGRARGSLLTGLALGIFGTAGFMLVDGDTPIWQDMIWTCIGGIGIGIVMPGTMISVQNAAERRDVGVATGTLLFLRSLGGAFGSTISGVLIAAGFASGLATMGLQNRVDLGALRSGSNAFAGLPEGSHAAAEAGLLHGFHLAFATAAALMAVAMIFAWIMRDVPLRSAPAAAPPTLGH